jgi:propanol-preferring alcohol dehydrogenase
VVHAFGKPLTIEEVPIPTPRPGEVLIKVIATVFVTRTFMPLTAIGRAGGRFRLEPLIRGVAPQRRDQVTYPTLGGGAGGRSPGSIYARFPRFCIAPIAALYLLPLCRCVSVPAPAENN